jgi:hypothetical protein
MGRQEGVDCIYRTEDRDNNRPLHSVQCEEFLAKLGKKDSCELRMKEGI